jgi:hypothetical protein
MLDVATNVLATARLTRLITEDELAEPIRSKLENSGNDKLAYLATCPYCVSVWAGLLVVSGLVPRKIKQALALSEATVAFRAAVDALPTKW